MKTTEQFTRGEKVWHINFKSQVEYLSTMKDGWHNVKLSNGGYCECKPTTITKYIHQDYIEATKNLSCYLCGFFCNNIHHYNNWFNVLAATPNEVQK